MLCVLLFVTVQYKLGLFKVNTFSYTVRFESVTRFGSVRFGSVRLCYTISTETTPGLSFVNNRR